MRFRSWSQIVVLVAGAGLAGCGGSSDGPAQTLVPVTGKVLYAGQVAAGMQVVFVPLHKTPGNGAFGVTDDEGEFELQQTSSEPGIPAGQYAVRFSRYVKSDGTPIPPGVSPYAEGGFEGVPAAWNDPAYAGPHNMVIVPEGGKSFDFSIPPQ